MTPQSPAVRLGWLDGLRGWAILLVVGIHTLQKLNLGVAQGLSVVPSENMAFVFGTGAFGVQLFYVISGFTMCYMWHYYKKSPHRIRDFLIRRFFRLAPMMYVAIALSVLTKQYDFNGVQLFLSLIFMTDVAPDTIFSYAPAGTTIDLECTFYLLFPVLVPYMHRWWLPVVCAVISIFWDTGGRYIPYAFHYHFILKQAVMFMIGGYMYHLIKRDIGKNLCHNYWLMPVVFALSLWFGHQVWIPYHFVLMGGMFGVLLMSAAYTKTPLFDNTLMRTIGILSFSIYLIHPIFVAAMASFVKIYGGLLYGFVGVGIVLMPTVLVCWGTYVFIEKKGIRLGKNIIKKLYHKQNMRGIHA